MCIFAVSVSAQRVENYDATYTLRYETVIEHFQKWYYNEGKSYVRKKYTDTITLSFVDENGNALSEVAMWEYDEAEGRYYSLVWYISDWTFEWEDMTYTDDNVGAQIYPKYTHATYTLSKVRAVDLRYYTHQYGSKNTSIESWAESRTLKALEGIYYDINNTPDDTTDDLKLQDAVGIGRDNDNYGYFGYEAQFEATGNKIVVGNFRDCDFQRDVEGNYGTANTWSGANNTQCIWYPDTVLYLSAGNLNRTYEYDLGDGIEIIACQVLRGNKCIKYFKVPNSVLFLNNESFRETDLTTLVVGENLVKHGGSPFLYTGGADYLYLSKNVLSVLESSVSALVANSSCTIYFDGDLEEATVLMEKMISEASSTYKGKVTLVDYNEQTERGDLKNVVIFYSYNRCEAFYDGQHDEKVLNSCQFGCERGCGVIEMLENPSHTLVADIAYGANIYFDAISAKKCCQACATVVESAEIEALFESYGVSAKTFGNDVGLVQGYGVNKAAIAEFTKYAPEFDFGVLVYANKNGEAVAPKPGDDKVIDIVFDNMVNNYIEIKVIGIPDDFRDTPVVFCIYAMVGERFCYFDNGEASESVVGISYSQLAD